MGQYGTIIRINHIYFYDSPAEIYFGPIDPNCRRLSVPSRLGYPYHTSSNRTEPYRAFSSRTKFGFRCSRSTMYGSNSIRAEPNY